MISHDALPPRFGWITCLFGRAATRKDGPIYLQCSCYCNLLICSVFVSGCLAMSCINEIISKNYFPVEYENFLIKMFQQTFTLLQQLTKGISTQDSTGILAKLDEK